MNLSAAPNISTQENAISEATGGALKNFRGKYFEEICQQELDYSAEVVDLNGDHQPEVFTLVQGTCLGGAAGQYVNLYIKDKNGNWNSQFGFPGFYVLKKNSAKDTLILKLVGLECVCQFGDGMVPNT